MTMRTFCVYTLGCKVNTYESEAMTDMLEESGRYRATDGRADIIIINSCMVTEESEKKAAKMIRRVKRENPGCTVLICGCMGQMVPEKCADIGADIVTGNVSRKEIINLIDDYYSKKEPIIDKKIHEKGEKIEVLAPHSYRNLTRANLKIEDGCDCYCSYCIIPYARGHVRSMEPEEVKRQAMALVSAGHREIVLTGINIGMYGRDVGKTLFDAVKAVKDAGADRIRLGSLEIDLLTNETIKKLAEIDGFCPHFHTSLQSGSDTVLKRMNRHYTADEYYETVKLIRETFENPSITTDVIVGFAGETEEEFLESAEFLKKVGFAKVHVFPYSMREGTAGALMKNQVPACEKKKRAKIMGDIASELSRKFLESQLDTCHEVLFETCENGLWFGHTENYIYVSVKSDENLKNQIKKVKIKSVSEETWLADGILV